MPWLFISERDQPLTRQSFNCNIRKILRRPRIGEMVSEQADITQIDISRNIAAAAQVFRREQVKVPTLADGLAVQKIVEALIA